MKSGKSFFLFASLWSLLLAAAGIFFLRAAPILSLPSGETLEYSFQSALAGQVVKQFFPGIYLGGTGLSRTGSGFSFSLPQFCFAWWQPLSAYVRTHPGVKILQESPADPAFLADADTENTPEEPDAGTAVTDVPVAAPTVQKEPASLSAAASVSAPQPAGISYTPEQLADFSFLLNTFFTLDPTTTVNETILDSGKLLAKDLRLTQDNTQPQILIYHTHSQEEFADSIPGDPATSIVGVGNYLAGLLTDTYGFNVIHNTSCFDLVDGVLDRNKAYTLALEEISRVLEENPSVQIVIDLHRDGIEGDKMTASVNGKETAKFMFFNGLSRTARNGEISYLYNPYIQDNLAFSLQLQLKAALYYPDVTRPIYLKGYRYNLHLRPRSVLVEAGSQKNTFQEELNAMDVLASILNMVLKGES